MLSSLRQYKGAPPARCSHKRAMSEGESSAAVGTAAAGGVETMELAAAEEEGSAPPAAPPAGVGDPPSA